MLSFLISDICSGRPQNSAFSSSQLCWTHHNRSRTEKKVIMINTDCTSFFAEGSENGTSLSVKLQFSGCKVRYSEGVSNLQLAGRMWPSQPFYVALATFLCGPSHDLGISQYEMGKHFLLLRSIDINAYTLSKRKGKQSQKDTLIKQKMCRCKSDTLKSRCCEKIHCSIVRTI
jgi:hypothetical protein